MQIHEVRKYEKLKKKKTNDTRKWSEKEKWRKMNKLINIHVSSSHIQFKMRLFIITCNSSGALLIYDYVKTLFTIASDIDFIISLACLFFYLFK